MSSSPGFARRFACTGCGKCCTGRGSYVIEVSRQEQDRIQRFLGVGRDWLRRRYVFRFDDETDSVRMHADGRCVFLDDKMQCRVYAVRPRQCRTYPFWPELETPQAWRAEARRCEGILLGKSRIRLRVEQE